MSIASPELQITESLVIDHLEERWKSDLRYFETHLNDLLASTTACTDSREFLLRLCKPGERLTSIDDTAPTPMTRFVYELMIEALSVDNQYDAQTRKRSMSAQNLLQDSIYGLAHIQTETAAIQGELGKQRHLGCSDAEGRFVSTLRRVEDEEERLLAGPDTEIIVYHDDTETPILLQKATGEKTSITLQGIGFGDFVLPPGTIVTLDRGAKVGDTGIKYRRSDILVTRELQKTQKILPVRLSPWAFNDPMDRAIFGTSGMAEIGNPRPEELTSADCYMTRAKLCAEHRIDDFRACAQKVLEICSVA